MTLHLKETGYSTNHSLMIEAELSLWDHLESMELKEDQSHLEKISFGQVKVDNSF